jgi:tetratricopeptide (TPR) repeat protein
VRPNRKLTRRERDVLLALCAPLSQGSAFVEPASSREVAEALGVSDAAVKQHLASLYDKFGIDEGDERRRTRLANRAVEAGIVGVASPVSRGGGDDALEVARKAAAMRNWPRAHEYLARVPADAIANSADDQELVGEASIWCGDPDRSIAARQRAYALHTQAGHAERAAVAALSLVINHVMRNNPAQASGWLEKARRHLEPSARGLAQGYVLLIDATFAMFGGALQQAISTAVQVKDIATGEGDVDLRALALAVEGYCLSVFGQHGDAHSKLDEAMAGATAGELGPLATGFVYCRTICASLDAFDVQRALEWTEAIERAGADPCAAGFPGDCRAHRASIYVLRGDWERGEREARTAIAEARNVDLRHAGIAENEIGTMRFRSGDLDAAETAFLAAHQLGHSPEPGLSLLALARGDADRARSLIRSALAHTPEGTPIRARLLPAVFEIALAASDLSGAEAAHQELSSIGAVHAAPALRAAMATTGGMLLLARGEPRPACDTLRSAVSSWLTAAAPYETACARIELARALRATGDDTAAALEIGAARPVLTRLGARPAIERAERVLAQPARAGL